MKTTKMFNVSFKFTLLETTEQLSVIVTRNEPPKPMGLYGQDA